MKNMSQNFTGLYYPSIQFKDDSWVKVAALDWDKLARIVPSNYLHTDSEVVKQLINEADFIHDLEPSYDDKEYTSKLFLAVLKMHGPELSRLYSLNQNKISSTKATVK